MKEGHNLDMDMMINKNSDEAVSIKINNDPEVMVWSVGADVIAAGRLDVSGLIPWEVSKVLSWYRVDYWHIPVHSDTLNGLEDRTQNLLAECRDGNGEQSYVLIMGMCDKDNCTMFSSKDGRLEAHFNGTLPGEEEDDTEILACGTGTDPFELVQKMFACLSVHMGTFALRTYKPRPEFLNYLGWCTWDAFYHTVDAEKVESGLASFAARGIRPGFMILDDGALSTKDDILTGFEISKEKFPGCFADFVTEMKKKYGLRQFGLWHAFEGYWAGIDPDSSLAESYRLVHNKGDIRPWEEKKVLYDLYMVDPDSIGGFFDDWYKLLKNENIDFLKVDGQSAMDFFTEGKLGRAGTMRKYQQAMQDAVEKYFGRGNVISCMSNGTDVYLNLKSGNVWRNSNDYFPKESDDIQQKHIYNNIYNSFLSANFAWPDWDMFQSHREHSGFHAKARAISGGPVYVCDYPNEQNDELLSKLAFPNGNVPVFDRPAIPTYDTLMVDTLNGHAPAKITNIKACGDVVLGTIGVFNCTSDEKVGTVIRANDIPEFKDAVKGDGESAEQRYALYDIETERVVEAGPDDEIKVELEGMSAKLYVVAPLINGKAVFGVKGMYGMAATVDTIKINTGDGEGVEYKLIDGADDAHAEIAAYNM